MNCHPHALQLWVETNAFGGSNGKTFEWVSEQTNDYENKEDQTENLASD
jgi:hypothetical protein